MRWIGIAAALLSSSTAFAWTAVAWAIFTRIGTLASILGAIWAAWGFFNPDCSKIAAEMASAAHAMAGLAADIDEECPGLLSPGTPGSQSKACLAIGDAYSSALSEYMSLSNKYEAHCK